MIENKESNKNKLNTGYYACGTCDNFEKCDSYIKNQSESVYCSEHRLRYGCEGVYLRSMNDEMED